MKQIIALLLVLLGIYKNSFSGSPPRFTCKNFLLNAYLYVFLSFILISLIVDIYRKNKVPSLMEIYKKAGLLFVATFLISLGLLITVMAWAPNNLIQKHLLWVTWIATMGYFLLGLAKKSPKVFEQAKVITFGIMLSLTLLTFVFPNKIKLTWGATLVTLLLGLIIVQLVGLLYPFSSQSHYYIAYFSLLLFSFFMLYDTKKLMVKAKNCVKADYINDSLGIFLNGLNIFVDIFRLRG